MEKDIVEKEEINLVIDEEKEFLNIINYKNVTYFRSGNYIYIGQIKNGDFSKEKENGSELRSRKEDEGKEEEMKKSEQKEKSQKKKKKKSAPIIREGYGILLKVKKNWNNDEIIINKFIGNWKNNQKNGLGFHIFSNKCCFYGTFQNNFINGWGHFKWNNGSQFEGTWKNNVITDIGTYKNDKILYEGYFYDNKFVNWDGSWIHLFETKDEEDNQSNKEIYEKKKDLSNSVSLEKDIHVVILPFDFVKRNLKNISDFVRQNFNATPFVLCSHQFLKKNKNFSLAHFVFLSFCLDTAELLLDHNQHLFYKSESHEKCDNSKKQINEQEECASECHSVEEETTSEDSNELSESSSESDEVCDSKHAGKKNETKKPWDYECADSPKYNRSNVDISNVNEYITDLCDLENKDERSSSFTQFSDDLDETKGEELNSLDTEEISFSNWTEKKRDEINKFITNHTNLYIDTDDSSSNYSPVFSEYELEKEEEEEEEEEKEHEGVFDKTVKTITENKKKTEMISEQYSAQENKKIDKPVKKNCETKPLFTSSEEIETEIAKIKIDMTFLKHMRKLHVPCQSIIKAKIKNALFLKYPFFLHLNISDEDNINKTTASNPLLLNFDIPEFWNLRNIFGMEPFKLPKEMLCPYHLERNDCYKKIVHSYTVNKEMAKIETKTEGETETNTGKQKKEDGSKMETNAQENTDVNQSEDRTPMLSTKNTFFDNLKLNMFIITDLVVDHINDVTYLKRLIKDKFQNWGNLLDFFFIIIS